MELVWEAYLLVAVAILTNILPLPVLLLLQVFSLLVAVLPLLLPLREKLLRPRLSPPVAIRLLLLLLLPLLNKL